MNKELLIKKINQSIEKDTLIINEIPEQILPKELKEGIIKILLKDLEIFPIKHEIKIFFDDFSKNMIQTKKWSIEENQSVNAYNFIKKYFNRIDAYYLILNNYQGDFFIFLKKVTEISILKFLNELESENLKTGKFLIIENMLSDLLKNLQNAISIEDWNIYQQNFYEIALPNSEIAKILDDEDDLDKSYKLMNEILFLGIKLETIKEILC